MRNVMFSFSLHFALLHLRNPPILNTFHFPSLFFWLVSTPHPPSLRHMYHFLPKITWLAGESP
jgi:hypothetical protein